MVQDRRTKDPMESGVWYHRLVLALEYAERAHIALVQVGLAFFYHRRNIRTQVCPAPDYACRLAPFARDDLFAVAQLAAIPDGQAHRESAIGPRHGQGQATARCRDRNAVE